MLVFWGAGAQVRLLGAGYPPQPPQYLSVTRQLEVAALPACALVAVNIYCGYSPSPPPSPPPPSPPPSPPPARFAALVKLHHTGDVTDFDTHNVIADALASFLGIPPSTVVLHASAGASVRATYGVARKACSHTYAARTDAPIAVLPYVELTSALACHGVCRHSRT